MRLFFTIVAVSTVSGLVTVSASHAGGVACAKPTEYDLYVRLPRDYPVFHRTLMKLWKSHWVEAAVVSFGEGRWSPEASNRQYQGTFQMGSSERQTYGHGNTLKAQAEAAFKYYLRSGWHPWACNSS